MGLEGGGCSKILDSGGQVGGIGGCLMLDGPQGGIEAARKGRGIDGCKELLLDGPQGDRSTMLSKLRILMTSVGKRCLIR